MKKNLILTTLLLIFVLTINAQVSFTSPAGGESWVYGSTHSIDINNSGSTINNGELYVIFNGGATEFQLDVGINITTNYSYNWEINPTNYTASNDYYFELREDVGTIWATSSIFEVSATNLVYRIDEPSAGANWINGTNHTIFWYSYQMTNVKIEYDLYDGNGWQSIENSYAVSEGSNAYNWIISGISGVNSNSQIRITDANDAGVFKESAVFTLMDSYPITFSAPTTGTQWQVGTTQTVTINNGGATVNSGDLFLYDNLGNSVYQIVGGLIITNGTVNYNWDINAGQYSAMTNCYIVASANGNVVGISDNFDLTAASTGVTEISVPTNGQVFVVGNSYDIYWGSIGVDNVKIEYNLGDGIWHEIVSSTPSNDGNNNYYSWLISGVTGVNSNSTIRVSNVNDASDNVVSAVFTITDSSQVTFTTPTSTTVWTIGTIQDIIMESTSGANINAELQFWDNGSQIGFENITITNGTNIFNWNIASSTFSPTTTIFIKLVDNSIPTTPITVTVSDQFELTTQTDINENTLNKFSIYPNPTNGIINLDFAKNNIERLIISDIAGKLIIEKTRIQQNEILDLSDFESGIYIITLQTDKETFTTKIIKE